MPVFRKRLGDDTLTQRADMRFTRRNHYGDDHAIGGTEDKRTDG